MGKRKIDLGDCKGIARRLEPLGRIVLPAEFRKELEINEDEEVWLEMFLVDDGIFVRKKPFLYKGEDVDGRE